LVRTGDVNSLSTLTALYDLLLPDSKTQTTPIGYLDVRDIAIALVTAIRITGQNRLLFRGEWFELKDAIDYIATVRPELKGRLAPVVPTGQTEPIMDNSWAEKLLGIKPRPWKETVIEAVDFFVNLEKEWSAQGVDIEELKKTPWHQ
jgi:hypothetical protein